MSREITNFDDIIDSREVIDRIEELTAVANEGGSGALSEAELAELAALRKLAEEAESYSEDWQYGATLVRGSYFTTYAKDYAHEIAIEPINEARWPYNHIDWDEAAEDLKVDYTEVDFDGVAYLVR